jgi:predicted RNA-binding protein with RPS1 domain
MGTPFKWEFDKEFTPKMQEWCGFKAGAKTQYINFTFNNNNAPSEILLYGYKVEDVVKEGDEITVKFMGIDERGRLNMSRKAAMPKPEGMPERPARVQRANTEKVEENKGEAEKAEKSDRSRPRKPFGMRRNRKDEE